MRKIGYLLGIICTICMFNLTGCVSKEDTEIDKDDTEDIIEDVDDVEEVILTDDISTPHFKETVELMSLIARLAGIGGFDICSVPEVTTSAEAYFESFKSHKAVQLIRSYRSSVNYDAVTGYGNLLCLTNKGRIVFDTDYSMNSSSSFDRWTDIQKIEMLQAVNDFYKKSNFHEWFESLKPLQEQAIQSFSEKCKIDYDWFDSYYWKNDMLETRIVLCFFIGWHNHGISHTKKDGTVVLTPTMGCLTWEGNKVIYGGDEGTLVHEFSHPYCNQLIDQHWSKISATASSIYSRVKKEMQSMAYGTPQSMMYENLVRACCIRYLLSHGYPYEVMNFIINNEHDSGFLLVPALVAALDEREAQGSKYPTLESFMPVIIDVINNYDKD